MQQRAKCQIWDFARCVQATRLSSFCPSNKNIFLILARNVSFSWSEEVCLDFCKLWEIRILKHFIEKKVIYRLWKYSLVALNHFLLNPLVSRQINLETFQRGPDPHIGNDWYGASLSLREMKWLKVAGFCFSFWPSGDNTAVRWRSSVPRGGRCLTKRWWIHKQMSGVQRTGPGSA